MDSRTLKTFKNISTFVEDLATAYGSKQHSLLLYSKLIAHTDPGNMVHEKAIKKHVQAFSSFLSHNSRAVLEKKAEDLKDATIFYSKKANIKLAEIFRIADSDSSKNIWKHLLLIMHSIDPASKASEILKKTMEEKSNEGEFLNGLVQKIENTVDPSSNDPMSALMSVMRSGVFTELFTAMKTGTNNGTLNMGKLLNTVKTLANSLGEGLDEEGNPLPEKANDTGKDVLNNVINMLGEKPEKPEDTRDEKKKEEVKTD